MHLTDEQIDQEFSRIVEFALAKRKENPDVDCVDVTIEIDNFFNKLDTLFGAFERGYPRAEEDPFIRAYVRTLFGDANMQTLDVARELRPIKYMQIICRELLPRLDPSKITNFYRFHRTYGGLIIDR